MKTNKSMTITTSVILAACLGVLAGCASHNYDKGQATAASLKASSEKIDAASGQLNATLASLNDLVNNPQPDLRPQYTKFSNNVDDLGKLARHVQDSVAAMREKGKEFFDQWNAQLAEIKNEDIRSRSTARQQEVSAALSDVKTSYAEAETAFRPLMSNLRDIQKYLGIDLTRAGVASMKDITAKTNEESATLRTAVAKLVADFKSLGVAMSAVAPAPPQ